jgi:hypothetical protein
MPAARAAAVFATTPPAALAASIDLRESFGIVFSYFLRPVGFRAAVRLIGNAVTEAGDNVH